MVPSSPIARANHELAYAGGWHWHLDGLGEMLGGHEVDRAGWSDLRDHYATASEDVIAAVR